MKYLTNICGLWAFIFLIGAVMTTAAQAVHAQDANIAYVDYDGLISDLPDIMEADRQIQAINAEWEQRMEREFNEFQAKVQQYQNMAEEGLLSPREIQEKEQELEQERDKVMGLQNEMERDVRAKRNEILRPLIEKLDTAISQIAEEKGINYVLDSSAGDLLFFEEANDISREVRQRYNEL